MEKKEQILDSIFKDEHNFYESKGVLHIGHDSTGKPGNWKAHPYCGKRLYKWIGFGEIHLSKTAKVCPNCLIFVAINKLSNKSNNKEGKE